jgi:hypothetical protein
MKLSVLDRVVILTILPTTGDFTELRVLQDLRMNLGFTEKEVKKFNVRVEGNQTLWDKNEEVDIPLGEKATDIVIASFKKMDAERQLSLEMMYTYEKFITTE